MKKITLIVIVLTYTIRIFAQVSTQMSLVGDYPFNNNANDISVSENDGMAFGATLTKDRFGKENSAYYFDGSSYITFPIKNIENNYYSISAWVNVKSLPISDSKASILALGNAGADQNLFLSNELGFGLTSYSQEKTTPVSVIIAPMPFLNTWYHLTVIRGDTYIKFYLNGELKGITVSPSSTATYTSNSLGTIGARHGGLFQTFNGTIDDIKIYSRALSENEVVSLHNSEVITGNLDFETNAGISIIQNNVDKNKFKIEATQQFSGNILMTNLQGRVIFETKILDLQGAQNIEISPAYKGMFILNVINEMGQSSKKKYILE